MVDCFSPFSCHGLQIVLVSPFSFLGLPLLSTWSTSSKAGVSKHLNQCTQPTITARPLLPTYHPISGVRQRSSSQPAGTAVQNTWEGGRRRPLSPSPGLDQYWTSNAQTCPSNLSPANNKLGLSAGIPTLSPISTSLVSNTSRT